MIKTSIRRGSVVYDVADPRHDGIVRSLHLCKGKLFANVLWFETGWHSYRVPVVDLREVPEGIGRARGWVRVTRQTQVSDAD